MLYVEQDLLERLTDCISDNFFFFFMNAFDSYKILKEMAWEVASVNWIVPSLPLSVLFSVPGRVR